MAWQDAGRQVGSPTKGKRGVQEVDETEMGKRTIKRQSDDIELVRQSCVEAEEERQGKEE